MQFLRFLRRAEGVEAARKYFLEARKSPSYTYHVYIAFATMAFCLDKDPKVDFLTDYVVYVLFGTAFLFEYWGVLFIMQSNSSLVCSLV